VVSGEVVSGLASSYRPLPTAYSLLTISPSHHLTTPMKLTVTIEGLASLPRFDATRLTARLQTEVERELQATALTTTRPLDATARRAALDRALLSLSPLAGRGSG
jgi:hypothetical protein